MAYHTHIICSKKIIQNNFAWELIFSASDMIQRCPTNPLVWTIDGLCSFTLSRNLGIDCNTKPDAKILHTLEKIISDYYGCKTIVNIQDQTYSITLSDDAHEKVDLMNTVEFGCWPQNGTKPEPLEWIKKQRKKYFYYVNTVSRQKDLFLIFIMNPMNTATVCGNTVTCAIG